MLIDFQNSLTTEKQIQFPAKGT